MTVMKDKSHCVDGHHFFQDDYFKKILDKQMKKHNDKMETAKQWLTPMEYHMLLRTL